MIEKLKMTKRESFDRIQEMSDVDLSLGEIERILRILEINGFLEYIDPPEKHCYINKKYKECIKDIALCLVV